MSKREHKKHPKLKIAIVSLLGIIVLAALAFMRFGGFNTGDTAGAEAISAYAGRISDISLPDSAVIVALGEATHGNSEFQQLKLDVFRHLVENYEVRALALEGDYGGCEQVNRYIHGGDGTAREAAAAIGFAIYRTEEMEKLIAYMREYNETAAAGDDLRFYGFDMQRCAYCVSFLAEACAAAGMDTGSLEALVRDDNWNDEYDNEARKAVIADVRAELADKGGSPQDLHFADILLQNCELQTADGAGYGDLRDSLMAENTLWIAQQEQTLGHERIFVTAHNGHVGKFGYDNMGKLLADELGKSYYAIGTDFYKTTCNMPVGSSTRRTDQVFYSHDPLAKAAKQAGYDICWLDFEAAADSTELAAFISDYNYMGSLGEGFFWYMRLLPPSYRIFQIPAQLYDGMIFVSEASPTIILAQE